MPYDIVEFPDGYRVRSANGTFLSKRPLSLARAKKQMTAVNIAEHKGGAKGDIVIPRKDFIAEHKKLLGILKKPTKSKLRSEYLDQSSELAKQLRGGDVPEPNREALGDMAEEAYSKAPKPVSGWSVVYTTPTIKAYMKGNDIIIAVRGTVPTDKLDLGADASIPFNNLKNTPRYKGDVQAITAIKARYPNATYYGVGHSLGGAIVDQLIADGLIKEAVSFNPAVEPQYKNSTLNQRIAHEEDPLYQTISSGAKFKEVIKAPLKEKPIVNTGISWLDGWANKAVDRFIPSLVKVGRRKLKAHNISSIFGRGACGEEYNNCQCSTPFKNQLEKEVGLTCQKYLELARAKAKTHGLNWETVEFANDKNNKLRITAPDGTIRKFGAVGYGDFLIWSHLEKKGKVPKGTANDKRHRFRTSHEAMKGNWRRDPYSPNNLAINILW